MAVNVVWETRETVISHVWLLSKWPSPCFHWPLELTGIYHEMECASPPRERLEIPGDIFSCCWCNRSYSIFYTTQDSPPSRIICLQIATVLWLGCKSCSRELNKNAMVQILHMLCYFPSIISMLHISLHFCGQYSIHRGLAFWNIVWTHVLSELSWQNDLYFVDLLTLKLHLYLTVTNPCVCKCFRVQAMAWMAASSPTSMLNMVLSPLYQL